MEGEAIARSTVVSLISVKTPGTKHEYLVESIYLINRAESIHRQLTAPELMTLQ